MSSGDFVFSASRNAIINGAFRLLGYNREHGAMPADASLDAVETLNMMMSAWQAEGIAMWKKRDITLFMQKAVASYSIGPSGDNATLAPYSTKLAADSDSGDSTITVDDDDDITDGDYIGIELDTGLFQWTTVDGDPASNVVTLTTALTGDTSENQYVANYTTKCQRPMEIIEARLRNSQDVDNILEIVSRVEYMQLSDKTSTGTPNIMYYDPQLVNAVMYLWQTTNDVENRVVFTAKYPIEIFSAFGDTADFPQEWFLALKYNLAVLLIPEYMRESKMSVTQINLLISQAENFKETVKSFDATYASAQFVPDTGRGR